MTKLRCEGFFTHREYEEGAAQPPFYIIYKQSSGGVYEASEHFNGLTAIIKGRRGDSGKRKAKVMRDFLYKVYRHRGGAASHSGKSTTKERYIAQLMKHSNPLYVSSDSIESIYRGCYYPHHPGESPQGGEVLKVNKHCLSHNYVLLNWDDESKLEGQPHEGKAAECERKSNSGRREEDPSQEGEEDIWAFVYLSIGDLLETHFEDHLRELYHERLRMKDKRVAVLLSFLFHHRVVRNLRVKSMVQMHMQKGGSSGGGPIHMQTLHSGGGLTKEVFTLSFDMHARSNSCVDHVAFLLDKFHCEDAKDGTFFTNKFLSRQMYAHSGKLKEEVRYENVTFVEGLSRGVLLLSYVLSQMGRVDRLVGGGASYAKTRRSYSIGGEDRVAYMPTLFRDHLYLPSDYFVYWEEANRLAGRRTVANVSVGKRFEGAGLKRACRVTVRVACAKGDCGGVAYNGASSSGDAYSKAAYVAPPLRHCSAVVLDLHPSGVVLDKERLASPHLTASFADVESYEGGAPPAVTKYRVSLSQGGASPGGLAAGALSPERGGEGATGEGTAEGETTGGATHLPCAAFSFDVQIGSRYVAPCERGKQLKRSTATKGVPLSGGESSPPTHGDDTCTDYDAVVLSNAKVFLKCEGDGEDSPAAHRHEKESTTTHRHEKESTTTHRHEKEGTTTHRHEESPATHRHEESPATHRHEESPAAHHHEESPAAHHHEESPAAHHHEESPAAHHHRRNATLYADATHVYINGGADMLSAHTRDFFLFLREVSFVQVLSPRWESGIRGEDCRREERGRRGEDCRREAPPEKLAAHPHFQFGYSLAREINAEKVPNKRVIYDEVLVGDPPWQHVAAANEVEMLRRPPPRGHPPEGVVDYYVDVVYVHSVPRGADSYLQVLCVSALTSALLVLCTFVLARRFG